MKRSTINSSSSSNEVAEKRTVSGLTDTTTSLEQYCVAPDLGESGNEIVVDKSIVCRGWVVRQSYPSWSTRNVELVTNLVVPEPQPTQVRVRVRAAGVNSADARRTLYLQTSTTRGKGAVRAVLAAMKRDTKPPTPSAERQFVPHWSPVHRCGLDGAGEVESVGSAVTAFKPGDRVMFCSSMTADFGGTFCEYALVDQDVLVAIPSHGKARSNITFEEAAALPCASGTAYLALFDKLRIEAGRSILISGGSGGVGSTAVQLAHYFGLYVIATCSTPHVRYVQQLGADVVLDYTAVDVVAETLRRTSSFGVDYVLEAAGVAHSLAETHAEALRFGGALCALNGVLRPTTDIFTNRQLSVHYVCLGMLHSEPLARPQLRQIEEQLLRLYADGAFRVEIERVPFVRAHEALDVVYRCHTRGKLVLTNFA